MPVNAGMSDAVVVAVINLLGLFVTGAAATIGAWFAYQSKLQGERNHEQGVRNHEQMNGRMTEMLEMKSAEGEAFGKHKERERAISQAIDEGLPVLRPPQHEEPPPGATKPAE
jgi:hypothetical protein